MSRVDTSSSGDESISPVASPKPTSSKPSSGLAIEPQAPACGRPTTRQATSRPPKRPDICSPSLARTQADSPASSYRSTRPAFPPIEKWTVVRGDRGHFVYIFNLPSPLQPYQAVREYLRLRIFQARSPLEPLFLDHAGKPASRTWFQKHLKAVLLSAGISARNFSSHSFRIGAATSVA